MNVISNPPRWAALAIPYLAVGIGLHWVGSVWLTFLLYHCGMLAVLFATRFNWTELARGWRRVPGVALLLICAAPAPVLIVFAGWFFPELENGRSQIDALGIGGSAWFPFLVYYVISTPMLEEAFWRGTLSRGRRWFDPVDLLFAGYHVSVIVLFVPPVAILLSFLSLWGAALIWRLIRIRTGGLLIPVLTHFVADLSIMLGLHFLFARVSG